MKKVFLITIAVLLYSLTYSQNNYVDDALKLSSNNYGGTARFVGMGGAFGALGGDFGSISINPAGLGVYRSSEFVFSPALSYNSNSSSYINKTTDENAYKMNVNNLSFVSSYDLEGNDSRWVNFNIGIGFNQINDLNDNVMFEGVNNSSLMEVFVNYANSDATPETANNLNAMYEYLLWDAYIIDSSGGVFFNEIDDEAWNNSNFGINQRKIIETEGYVKDFNISFAGNYAHKLYVGASIGVTWLKYDQYSSHYEYETSTTPIDYMSGFDFREHSRTTGTGFNLKLGAIYKPIEFLRLGVSMHLPTFYTLNKEYYNEVYGCFDAEAEGYARSEDQKYEYQLQTPLRFVGSVGFQVAKIALIDIDYELVDYSTIELGDDFNSEGVITDNNTISDIYQKTHNIRAGAELRFGSIYVRGGGKYSTNPYTYIDDYSLITVSGGLGYREKNFFLDLAFSQTVSDYYITAYNWQYNDALAHVENTINNFVLTFGVKF
ncbi:MAG: hypothetical protein JEY96_02285 [Bacteroidales bacterium]|nr:hypothetical protein [Bacteroidales bacterium]